MWMRKKIWCACVCVSDQEGGRWRSVSRRGPEGGAVVGEDSGNGAKFQSVYVCV